MDTSSPSPYDNYISSKPTNLKGRVALIMKAIQRSVERRPDEDVNAANVRHLEEFFSFLTLVRLPVKITEQ